MGQTHTNAEILLAVDDRVMRCHAHPVFEKSIEIIPDGTWTVLVVEPEARVRASLTRCLEQDYRVLAAPSVQDALSVLNTEEVDLLLCDHKRGAFTGAISDRLGLFPAADDGTVFLDEISEISPSFQVSLLRFLQEGEVKPLRTHQTRHAT